jgi:hypothetical protein
MVESAFPGGASVQLALSPWHRAGHLALRLPVHTSIARIWSATVSNVSGCVARIQLADYPSTTLGMILRSHHSGEDAPIDWSHAIELLGADGLPCTMHRVCGSGDCAHGAAYPYVAAVALQLDGAAAPDPEECQQMGRLMSELLPHPAHHDASLGASLTARNPASYLTTLPTPDGSVLVVFSLAQPQDVTTLAATPRPPPRPHPPARHADWTLGDRVGGGDAAAAAPSCAVVGVAARRRRWALAARLLPVLLRGLRRRTKWRTQGVRRRSH